jgi:hypothetical protein
VIEELRIYRVRAGGLGEYLRLAAEVQMPIRGDRHGLLLGFWHAEVGAANSVFNLWRHQGLDHRQEVRARLDGIEAWHTEYLAKVWPLMEEQVIRLMQPVKAFSAPVGSHVYEVRFIRTRVGEARKLADRLLADAPAAFRDSTAGLALTVAGHLNEIVHISAHASLDARARLSLTHPEWQGFLDRNGDVIAEMESSLLLPASHSPAQ